MEEVSPRDAAMAMAYLIHKVRQFGVLPTVLLCLDKEAEGFVVMHVFAAHRDLDMRQVRVLLQQALAMVEKEGATVHPTPVPPPVNGSD